MTKREWKHRRWGRCSLCSNYGPIERHHVVLEQIVRRLGGDPWNVSNSMLICPVCQQGHHHPGVNDTRIPYAKVPQEARNFAYELLGEGADDYFRRRYADAP